MDIKDLKDKIKKLENEGLVNDNTELVVYATSFEEYLEVNNIRVPEENDFNVIEEGLILEIDF